MNEKRNNHQRIWRANRDPCVEWRDELWICDWLANPGPGGAPPHRHLGEGEVFTVIDGEFEFFDGESWVSFHRGEAKYSLRGSYHGFRNMGQSAGKMFCRYE